MVQENINKMSKVDQKPLNMLGLLMWKNLLQQWRHKLQTISEISLPVLTAALVIYLRGQEVPTLEVSLNYPPIDAKSFEFSTMVLSIFENRTIQVSYSPESPILDDVIRSAVINLLRKNIGYLLPAEIVEIIQTIPDEILKSSIALEPHKNASSLANIFLPLNATRNVLAGIQFDDSLHGATSLPDNLRYKIRFPIKPRQYAYFNYGGYSWRTSYLFPLNPMPGPRFRHSWEGGNDPAYVNEMFTQLMHAISMELIYKKTGDEELRDLPVWINRYPHPDYVNDNLLVVLPFVFPMFMMLTFTYSVVATVKVIIREKELQLKETMKIMGLPIWLHWTAWFLKQFLFLTISVLLICIIVKLISFDTNDVKGVSVFTKTPFLVLYMYLSLYIATTIFFAFLLTSCFSVSNTATIFTAIVWFMSFIPYLLMVRENKPISPALKATSCLSINTAMALGFNQIFSSEGSGRGMHWDEFFTPINPGDNFLFGHVILMLLFDCLLYMLLTLYIEKVFPGAYGIAEKWYFIFTAEYWTRSSGKIDITFAQMEQRTDVISESEPTVSKVGVCIKNLSKKYGDAIVVDRLNMNIYKDQITVLLGHNGAGKTTTISMMTGMIPASYGTVHLVGYDIATQTDKARSNLGLCPQNNIIFNDLTVRENLLFFTRLKGCSGSNVEQHIDNLINKLELTEKANKEAGCLSGGQKRRLCVGIALCGDPEVVFLDEPTSGMDPAARRALWDLLQSEKAGKAIILTTHFMDEADILGDRIAIMSHGKLKCIGSSFFLKNKYCTGYTLVIVKDTDFDERTCTEQLRRHISSVEVKHDFATEISYHIPTSETTNLENLLLDLEKSKEQLKYNSFGLSFTTLEDVFMKVGSELKEEEFEKAVEQSESISANGTRETNNNEQETELYKYENVKFTKIEGSKLQINHVKAMFLKRFYVSLRSWRSTLMQFVFPLLLLWFSISSAQLSSIMETSAEPLTLTLETGYGTPVTYMGYNDTSTLTHKLIVAYRNYFKSKGMILEEFNNISVNDYYMLEAENKLVSMRTTHMIGVSINDTGVTTSFSNFGYHDVAVTLATLHNAVYQYLVPGGSLSVENHPLPVSVESENEYNQALLNGILSMQFSNSVGSGMSIIVSFFVMFYVKERLLRSKLLQKSSGLEPFVLWFSVYIFDYIWFAVIGAGMVFTLWSMNVDGFNTINTIGISYVVILIYGLSILPFNYLLSLMFTGHITGFTIVYFMNTLIGPTAYLIVESLRAVSSSPHVANALDDTFKFFPTYSFVAAIRVLNSDGLMRSSCDTVCDIMGTLNGTQCSYDVLCSMGVTTCCFEENQIFKWDVGIVKYLVCMFVFAFFVWVILMIIEYRLIYKIFYRTTSLPEPDDRSTMDSDVLNEMKYVEDIHKNNRNQYNLICNNLTKYYGNLLAVNRLSFNVRQAECFGLLGVNGAGKTTTFKMLTGDISISAGDAFVKSYSIKTQLKKVREHIGYCPQFDAILDELTGRETLNMYALLRGIPTERATLMIQQLSECLGFARHLDKTVNKYSGGTKRKLSTALALLGNASLVFLDEPTTGVDPGAKRQVWGVLRSATNLGRGVVLTSHSMEECEALCNRIGLMVNGQFVCLGSPQHLKNKFSHGYTLIIKIKRVLPRASNTNIGHLKQLIKVKFADPQLIECYESMLTYYIDDTSLPWSTLFGVMEWAKAQEYLIDYSITQTTLEQVFLRFTKYQK